MSSQENRNDNIGGDQEQDYRSKEEMIIDAEAPQTVTVQILVIMYRAE